MPMKTEKAARGQKIRTDSGPDKSSHDVGAKIEGGKMGGGPNDVSHSLSNAGKTVTYNDK